MRRFALALALLGPSLALLACEPRVVEPTPAPATPAPAQPRAPEPLAPEPASPPPRPPLVEGEVEGIHYVEFVTGEAEPNAALPMIVAIHGLGDTPENFAELLFALDRPARVILPRALDPVEEGGWSWFPIRARDPDVEALAEGIAGAAGKLAPAITELSETRPTRGKPIVTGFSQGGMLTFMLAVEHPELVGYAVAIGGWLPPPRWPKAGPTATAPKLVALHGDADKAVAFGPTREAVDHLRGLGWPVELHGYPNIGHAIPPVMRDELFTLLRGHIDQQTAPEPKP